MEKIFTIKNNNFSTVWEEIRLKVDDLSKKYNLKMELEESIFSIKVSRSGFTGTLKLQNILEEAVSIIKIILSLDFSWFVPSVIRNNICEEIEIFIKNIK